MADVDLKDRTLRVRCGKGGKGRIVPLGRKACLCLLKYLEFSRPRFARILEEDRLFLTAQGIPLRPWSLREILKRYKKKPSLPSSIQSLSPHTFRHATALHMLRGGASLPMVQKMLGHTRPSTTQVYTRLCLGDLKSIHRRCHPRERLKALKKIA
jgi:integrase/recombinase XerD